MLTKRQRHHLLQRLFWNRHGAFLVSLLIRYEQLFDVVVRNYSLIGETNGEQWLLSLLDHEPTAFDVGFHDGASTRHLLNARRKSHVIGFDPSLSALRKYETGFAHDKRVAFEHVGLSNHSGTFEFYDYENMCNSLVPRKETLESPTVYEVAVTTVDTYCDEHEIDHINFLKIDAEGFDLHILEGAQDLLRRQGVDILTFEFASGWAASKRYLWEAEEYFQELPYSLFRLFNGFLCPLVYNIRMDSACTLSTMYVGISDSRISRGDIPLRHYKF